MTTTTSVGALPLDTCADVAAELAHRDAARAADADRCELASGEQVVERAAADGEEPGGGGQGDESEIIVEVGEVVCSLERILSVGSETVEVVPRRSRQDDRSVSKTIEIHRIVLEKFLDDPNRVLKFGRTRLQLLERSLTKRSSSYIETWQRLLDGPRSDIVRLLLSTDEEDIELLKMSPFTTLLNDDERDEVTRRSKLRRAGAR